MTRIRVASFTLSLDGDEAGPHQDIDNPLGVGGPDLHQWLIPTRTFQRTLFGKEGGTTGGDDDFAARGFQNLGAWILGRKMFGLVRGPWPDMDGKGRCGDGPRYVFVLTHPARPPLEMEGDKAARLCRTRRGTDMEKLAFGMNQSLDGFVDRWAFGPGPALFCHLIEEVEGQTGGLGTKRNG